MANNLEVYGRFAHQIEFLIDIETKSPNLVHYVTQEDLRISVTKDVSCFVYTIDGKESEMDLGIVQIVGGENGAKTPRQKVLLEGSVTIEKAVKGAAILYVKRRNSDKVELYDFTDPASYINSKAEVVVHEGDEMQWVVKAGESLVFHELCTPPFSDGRFVTIEGEGDLMDLVNQEI